MKTASLWVCLGVLLTTTACSKQRQNSSNAHHPNVETTAAVQAAAPPAPAAVRPLAPPVSLPPMPLPFAGRYVRQICSGRGIWSVEHVEFSGTNNDAEMKILDDYSGVKTTVYKHPIVWKGAKDNDGAAVWVFMGPPQQGAFEGPRMAIETRSLMSRNLYVKDRPAFTFLMGAQDYVSGYISGLADDGSGLIRNFFWHDVVDADGLSFMDKLHEDASALDPTTDLETRACEELYNETH